MEARRITDPFEEEDEEDDDEEDPDPERRGAAGITPEARGAGIGRGVCTLEAARVTRINDPGAGGADIDGADICGADI